MTLQRNMNPLYFMAKACVFAQEHIDDQDAWNTDAGVREELLQCTSYQMACFLAQHTIYGLNGVEWDVVLAELVEHPMKTEEEWKAVLNERAEECGGWLTRWE